MTTLLAWFLAIAALLLVIAVLFRVLPALFLIIPGFDWKLFPAVRRARREIRKAAWRCCPGADVLARMTDPRHFRIKTTTDLERDQLCEDPTIYREFCEVLYGVGYPPAQVPSVSIQSQETINRKFGGSWHEAKQFPEIE